VTWHKVAPRLAKGLVYILPARIRDSSARRRDRHINYSFRPWRWTRSDDASFWAPQFLVVATIGVLASPIGCASTFPRVSKGLSHGHRSDVDDVSRNQSRVCDEVHVVVFLIQGRPARTSHWLDLILSGVILSGLNKTPGALTPEAVSEYLAASAARRRSCHMRGFKSGCDIDLEMDEADDRVVTNRGSGPRPLGGKKQRRAVVDVLAPGGESHLNGYRHSLDCGHFLQEERPTRSGGTAAILCTA